MISSRERRRGADDRVVPDTAPPLITLLTDFGLDDAYVAAMKGVILERAPAARIVDICHTIPPGDLLRGGIIWGRTVPYFPRGAVHVAVIDPGVGSRRRILACAGRGSVFLVPDNGLIGCVLARREIRRAVALERRDLFRERVSATFHGRDIFAPVAAALAQGMPLEELGPPVRRFAWLSPPRSRRRRVAGCASDFEEHGEVLWLDRFGNAVTNLRLPAGARLVALTIATACIKRLSRTYADVRPGRLLALEGSGGTIEVSVRDGSAADQLALQSGARVRARWRRGRQA